jgi:hypothetical protein
MRDLHRRHGEIDKDVQVDRPEVIMLCIQLNEVSVWPTLV